MPARRSGDSLDFDIARAFNATIPRGRWAAYGDVAAAAGRRGARSLGHWLGTNEIDGPPLLYRVIRSNGRVSRDHVSVDWPGLPDDPGGVEQKLRNEGVRFDERGRADQLRRWPPDHWRRTRERSEPRARCWRPRITIASRDQQRSARATLNAC